MSSNINMVKELIRSSVKASVTGTTDKDEEIRARLEEDIFEELKEEIISLELDSIKQKILEENKKTEKLKNIQRIKSFMFETLILGFLVGLAVNQSTDFITHLKGGVDINLGGTGIAVIIILVVSVIFILLSYMNKLEKLFLSSDNKE